MKPQTNVCCLLFFAALFLGCARHCPPYPTDRAAYYPKHHIGETFTYCVLCGTDTAQFLCMPTRFSEAYQIPYGQKCVCEPTAIQTLKADGTTINYHHFYWAGSGISAVMQADSLSRIYIGGSVCGIEIGVWGTFGGDNGNMQFLPTWTSQAGYTYQNVYFVKSSDDVGLYLAPDWGIVQIETPEKICVLK